MLKYRVKNNDTEVKYKQIDLGLDGLEYLSKSESIIGFFNRSEGINNKEVVSVLTPNVTDYQDTIINTEEIHRTGVFCVRETLPIKKISGYVQSDNSDVLQYSQYIMQDDGNEYDTTKTKNIPFHLTQYVIAEKRYITMPNGKIYYEKYDENGKTNLTYNQYYSFNNVKNSDGYFEIDNVIIEEVGDTINLNEVHYMRNYYVDNGYVTYNNMNYSFDENYTLDVDGNIIMNITDNEGNVINLGNFIEYTTPYSLTRFEIDNFKDNSFQFQHMTECENYYYIVYNKKKYQIRLDDGKWELIQYLNENNEYDIPLLDIDTSEINSEELSLSTTLWINENYPSSIKIKDEIIPIEIEFRPNIDGGYLYVYTAQNINDDILQSKLLVPVKYVNKNFDIREDRNKRLYINYFGQRVYLSDDVIYTISEYSKSKGLKKYEQEAFDYIYDEFEVTLVEDGVYKRVDGDAETLWKNKSIDGTRQTVSAQGVNFISKGEKKNAQNSSYKVNTYHYVEIDGTKYKANLTDKNRDNQDVEDVYSVSIFIKENYYQLQVDAHPYPNVLICRPLINYEEYLVHFKDTSYKEGDDINSLQYALNEPYNEIIKDILNLPFNEFIIQNEVFGHKYQPSLLVDAKQNILDANAFQLYKKLNYFAFPIKLDVKVENNLLQEDIVNNKFYQVEKDKAINDIIDMEKDIYYPKIKNSNGISDVYEIQFNFHFRSRDNEWKVKETSYVDYYGDINTNIKNDSWNIFDSYNKKNLNFNEISSSDLLCFLNFTEDDVFYQKSKISKSFIRLSFYDSTDINSQTLMHSSTIFMDENKLYSDFVKNVVNENYKIYNDLNSTQLTTCSVNTEPIINKTSATIDYSKDRLSCTFRVNNKYETSTSSEGFYIYMYKEYGTQKRPSPLYMKVEFNHAGEGKILPFFIPSVKDGEITYMVNGGKELVSLNEEQVNKFKLGLPLNQVWEAQFIKLETIFDEELQQYIYYIPPSFMNTSNNTNWKNNKIVLNLWEVKIKDES